MTAARPWAWAREGDCLARVARRAEAARDVRQANRPLAAVFSPAPTSWPPATSTASSVSRARALARRRRASRSRRAGTGDRGRVQRRRSQLAAARGSQTVVWSVRTGSRRVPAVAGDPVQAIAFASGGGQLAAGDIAGVTRVWNLRTGQAVEVRGHEGTITGLAFSPDGESFATASEDETGGIWDAGKARRSPSSAAIAARARVAFAPGRRTSSPAARRMIRTWPSPPTRPGRARTHPRKRLRDVGFAPVASVS